MENWLIWSLVLFVAGLLITVVEVMVPSGGLLAIAAFGCLVGSAVCAYQISGVAMAILIGIEAICVPIVVVLAFKVLPRTSLGKQLILSPPAEQEERGPGPPAGDPKVNDEFGSLLGAEGVVVAPLRPSGTVEFAGRRVSVVSDGQSIPNGTRVRVVHAEGNRVVVEAVEA